MSTDTFGSQAAREAALSSIKEMLRSRGVRKLYVKRLAPNDNSKNQIYLGGDFSSLNIIPVSSFEALDSSSGRDSLKPGKPLIRGAVKFSWLDCEDRIYPAPNAKLILYPQYPEVRFSGYLLGSGVSASEWMDVKKQGRSQGRFLLIGIQPDGNCLGYLSVPGSRISKELDELLASDERILAELPIGIGEDANSSRYRLLHELRRIHLASPIAGKIFDKVTGKAKPYRASNGGGYTLEAELGISPNGYSEPDFDGWEVKTYSGSVLTLMTPEPNGGIYQSAGVDAFVRTYGYPDKNGKPDRLNFGGIHRIDERNELTGLTMKFVGYTAGSAGVEPGGSICLVDSQERIAAEWSFAKLLEHWNKKHAKAAYVPYSAEPGAGSTNYSYADHVSLGEGTNFIRFLQAFALRSAYYDPGIKLVGASGIKPEIKRRSQFRIRLNRLDALYDKWESVDLL